MLITAFRRGHTLCLLLTLTGLAATLATVASIPPLLPQPVTPLLIVDGYALFYWCLIQKMMG